MAICGAVFEAEHTEANEQLLLDVLAYNDLIVVACTPMDGPHCCSPEDMLKSAAMQVLADWTGTKHLATYQRFAEMPHGHVHSVSSAVIQKVKQRQDHDVG